MMYRACAVGFVWLAAIILAAGIDSGCFPAEDGREGSVRSRAFPLGEGTFEEVTSFGTNPGGLKMFRYVPPDVGANAPLVLALHACTQTAQDYRRAGWEAVADEHGFYVVYPEQQLPNNAMRCFNWAGEYGDPANLQRGQGENQSIVDMVDQMVADYSIDEGRVFVSGHSGGGAQAALMLATWPDVFAAGAVIAGIPYHCTTDFLEVYTCLQPGIDRTPEEWGDRVVDAFPGYTGAYPRVSVWHGTADAVVGPSNQTELVEQWTNVHGIDATPDVEDQVDGYPHVEYHDEFGDAMVETYAITGAGHGTFIDSGNGCGELGLYMLDEGICSSLRIAEFFGLTDGGGPVGDPDADAGTGDAGSSDVGGDATTDASTDPPVDPEIDPLVDMGDDVGGTDTSTCDCQCPSAETDPCPQCDSGCNTLGVGRTGWPSTLLTLFLLGGALVLRLRRPRR